MQTTLLSLAIAIILALVAALVGPYFIDWERYRSTFEAEATRLIGQPVHLSGAINVRLLPTPSISVDGVEVGPSGEPANLRVQSLEVELALAPLVRGQWRATALHFQRPELSVGIDQKGKVEGYAFLNGIDPDRLSVDRLVIDDGHVILHDSASGARMTLDQLWFNGELRSLAGPFKGEGAFVSSSQLYGYSVSAGRRGDDGGSKIHLSIDPADRPLSIETEGTLWVDNGAPRYEGTATLARLVGTALSNGKKVVTEPWRMSSHVRADPSAALLEQFQFQYGPEDRAIKFTGTADFVFGPHPRFEGVLSAGQVDLDRSFASPDAQRRPMATLRSFAANLGDAIRPPIPIKLGFGIDSLTVGGAALQTVRGDISSDAEAWNLQTFEFHAPGLTDIKLSGRLKVTSSVTEFVGPAAVESNDPSALMAWVEGLNDPPKMAMTSLRLRGDITLGNERIAIDRLKADADGKTFDGRLAYTFSTATRGARLDAALSAADVDVDGVLAFANAALAGSKFERPSEIALSLDMGRATFAGAEAKQIAANVELDASGVRIQRLSISDLAGATLTGSGQIDASSAPRGALTLALDAGKFEGVAALAAKLVPSAADLIKAYAARAAPAKLNATLNVDPVPGMTATSTAKLVIDGKLGAAHVNITTTAVGELKTLSTADLRLDGLVEADDGSALAALLGFDRFLNIDKRPARMTLTASGNAGGDILVDSKMTSSGLEASAAGTLRLTDQGVQGHLDVSASAADVTALHRDAAAPIPFAVKSRVSLAGNNISLRDFVVTLAGSSVRGEKLALVLGQPIHIEGQIAANTIDIPALMAYAIGMPASPSLPTAQSAWPSEPFNAAPLPDLEGKITFYAVHAALVPGAVAQPLGGVLHFEPNGFALENGVGSLADGRLTMQASAHRGSDGLTARSEITLSNADLAKLSGGGTQPRMTGHLSLKMEAEGTGLSPATLVGALNGTGTVTVEGAQFAGFDPAAIETTIQTVDRGLPIDAAKINDAVVSGLQAGRLNVPTATGAITITSGRASIDSLSVPAEGADVLLNGLLDVGEQSIDLKVKLTGPSRPGAPAGQPPDISIAFKGPLSAPSRTINVASFTNWLTLRSVERETKRLEELQSERAKQQSLPPRTERVDQRESEKAPDLPPPTTIKPSGKARARNPDSAPIGLNPATATPSAPIH